MSSYHSWHELEHLLIVAAVQTDEPLMPHHVYMMRMLPARALQLWFNGGGVTDFVTLSYKAAEQAIKKQGITDFGVILPGGTTHG